MLCNRMYVYICIHNADMLIYRCWTSIQDKREYAKFEREQKKPFMPWMRILCTNQLLRDLEYRPCLKRINRSIRRNVQNCLSEVLIDSRIYYEDR